MDDIFSSSRLKIRGANEELGELKTGIETFFNAKPYESVIDTDTNGIHEWHKVKLTKDIPDRFGLLCARIATEFRDALDHAGYAAAIASGAINPKKTYFPICRTLADFDNCVKQNCRDLPANIQTLFRSFKAHPGGDELLIALNNISGGGKHCVIKPVGQGVGGTFYKNLRLALAPGGFTTPALKWDSTKNEIVLFCVGRGAKLQYDMNISFFIAFGDIDIVGGQPVTAFFDAIASKVEGIVNATEAEARRVGWIT